MFISFPHTVFCARDSSGKPAVIPIFQSGERGLVTDSPPLQNVFSVFSKLIGKGAPNIFKQRKRISHVTYEEIYDGINGKYDHATHYEYDIHGNVKTRRCAGFQNPALILNVVST